MSSLSLAADLHGARQKFATYRCLLAGQEWLTFSQVGALSDGAFRALESAGAEHGDRVVLWMPNSVILDVLSQAVIVGGLVRVAVTHRLHVREVADVVMDCAATVVCCAPADEPALKAELARRHAAVATLACADFVGELTLESIPKAAPPSELPREHDVAMLLYSSGTTGRPKGVVVTHGSWAAQARASLRNLPVAGCDRG